jgi:cytidylate kinase
VIAIDGPAGAGKSTVALRVAQALGFLLVDTGALYRGVALLARERGIDWDDAERLGALARELDLRLERSGDEAPKLFVDGTDRSAAIRTPEMSMGASQVSKHAEVRDALRGLQRQFGEDGGVVLEGRDIGTVIFPDAEAKIFLTASARTRAERRVRDLEARGIEADFDETLADVEARDAQDANRAVAPLRPAEDSVVIDSTGLGVDAVVARILDVANRVG